MTPRSRRRKPDLQRQKDRSVSVTRTSRSSSFSAPIPPPAWLEQYEQIQPGAADRIFRQWEQQSAHRQSLESTVVDANIRNERLGMCFAFVLALVVFGISWWLLAHGFSVAGLCVLVGEVVGLISVFRWGRRTQIQERESKREAEIAHPILPFGE